MPVGPDGTNGIADHRGEAALLPEKRDEVVRGFPELAGTPAHGGERSWNIPQLFPETGQLEVGIGHGFSAAHLVDEGPRQGVRGRDPTPRSR